MMVMQFADQDNNLLLLRMLNSIEADPDVTQAMLADALHISVGKVNGRLKHLLESGCIEVQQARRRKLRYIITAKGRAWQHQLAEEHLQQRFQAYRHVRKQVKTLLHELRQTGVVSVRLMAAGDVADVCRLTCLEQQVELTDDNNAPTLVADGLEVRIVWP